MRAYMRGLYTAGCGAAAVRRAVAVLSKKFAGRGVGCLLSSCFAMLPSTPTLLPFVVSSGGLQGVGRFSVGNGAPPCLEAHGADLRGQVVDLARLPSHCSLAVRFSSSIDFLLDSCWIYALSLRGF